MPAQSKANGQTKPHTIINRPPALPKNVLAVTFNHTLPLRAYFTTETDNCGFSPLEALAESLAGEHYEAAAKKLGLASPEDAWLEGAAASTDGRKLHITLYFAPYRDGCPSTIIR